jgi:hypothetical protein
VLVVCENDKQKVPISKMAKVANMAGLAKTLTGDFEIFILGSLCGEWVGCLVKPISLLRVTIARSYSILLWQNVHRGRGADTFARSFFVGWQCVCRETWNSEAANLLAFQSGVSAIHL